MSDDSPRVHAETAAQWRDWLAGHHDVQTGVWLMSWKKATGRPAIGYAESVVEALAWGWVDSKGGKVDDERTMLYFARRRHAAAGPDPTSSGSSCSRRRAG